MSWTYSYGSYEHLRAHEQSRTTLDYAHHSNSPYVESYHSTAPLPSTPAQNFIPNWPTPSSQPRLITTPSEQQKRDSIRARRSSEQVYAGHSQGLGLYVNVATPAQQHPACGKPAYSTPSEQPKRAVISPHTFSTPHSSQPVPLQTGLAANPFTPPLSAEQFRPAQQTLPQQLGSSMTQRRMSSHGQRPLMGPPETPSRGMIPQSPNLFTSIQFSPDLFSQQMMEPQSAPVYPQQRLFWDPATATPLQSTPQQFHTPTAFPDDFSASFNSNSTIIPQTYEAMQPDISYDLPPVSETMPASFMDGSTFPAPFQTSPRLAPPPADNPTQFLSSPARRFGGEVTADNVHQRRVTTELPAYHHQIQESRREKELLARTRRKSRPQKRPADEDLVMKSVRRALSPKKSSRPGLTRSATFGGVQAGARRSSSTLDNVSIGSSISSRSTRAGRSSPLKQMRSSIRRSSASATTQPSSSISLEIDKNGVARTIMNSLPEDDDEYMDDQYSTDPISSEDETDQQILYSFSAEPSDSDSAMLSGDARDELRSSAYLSMGSDKIARIARAPSTLDPRLREHDPASTIRRARGETLTSSNTDATNGGNAQQALRALLQDRSRSASSHASTSSMQFHSSPPIQQGQFPNYNGSPTTITDPDLATPSTDTGSHGSASATRCVCNSASPDGNIMIQW